MQLLSSSLLTLLVFVPVTGAALLYLLPVFGAKADPEGRRARWFSFTVASIALLFSLVLLAGFDPDATGMQFGVQRPWIPSLGVQYSLGVDGISLFLVLLTAVLMPLVMLGASSVTQRRRGYVANMLLLETAMFGALLSLDLFLFYVFWELMLAPMYFIIGIWGGKRRIYATLKFVLYTVSGSLLMLAAILYLVWRFQAQNGELTFALDRILRGTNLSLREELWLFAAFALAFAIKVPLFPLHTWLPDAHVEAPAGGSVILAAILLKMGLYGFFRFAFPLFPRAAANLAPFIGFLAVIGIVYAALVAWAQTDIKKLIAYSSVSHLGFCVLGFVAFNLVSLTGSVFQMLSHGISTGALFFLVGALYDRTHSRDIADYGGFAAKVPACAAMFLIFTLSAIALPLTTGFVGEFMILLGAFRVDEYRWMTTIAVSGVVLGAVYMLSLYLRTMFGKLDQQKYAGLRDLTGTEIAIFAPLVALTFLMGIYPYPILRRIEPTLKSYMSMVENSRMSRESFEGQQENESEEDEVPLQSAGLTFRNSRSL